MQEKHIHVRVPAQLQQRLFGRWPALAQSGPRDLLTLCALASFLPIRLSAVERSLSKPIATGGNTVSEDPASRRARHLPRLDGWGVRHRVSLVGQPWPFRPAFVGYELTACGSAAVVFLQQVSQLHQLAIGRCYQIGCGTRPPAPLLRLSKRLSPHPPPFAAHRGAIGAPPAPSPADDSRPAAARRRGWHNKAALFDSRRRGHTLPPPLVRPTASDGQ